MYRKVHVSLGRELSDKEKMPEDSVPSEETSSPSLKTGREEKRM